jgi:hypothetical protein
MRQGIIRQKRGSGQEELSYEAWNSQEVEDISVPFVRHMAFDKQSIVNLYEYWLLATIGNSTRLHSVCPTAHTIRVIQ